MPIGGMAVSGAMPPRPWASFRSERQAIRSPPMPDTPSPIRVNRAPVLTVWATVVAERLGYPPEATQTIGWFVASLLASAITGQALAIDGGAVPAVNQ
jgi:hypothetical protein